ncbi:MAG: hypothetical protein HOG49_38650 [Candidatus Scalindua sp.]|jgi:hypothetical protein|nr:hypothetical protein [Candidatus Scalindua sp.]
MLKVAININKELYKETIYVLDFIFNTIGIQYELTEINYCDLYYGKASEQLNRNAVYIPSYDSRPDADLKHKRSHNIDLLYTDSDPEPNYFYNDSRFGFDIIYIIFCLLTNHAEVSENQKDFLGRFMSSRNPLIEFNLNAIPIVDIYLKEIEKILLKKFPNLKAKEKWPEGKKAAAILTHDVDTPEIRIGEKLRGITRISERRISNIIYDLFIIFKEIPFLFFYKNLEASFKLITDIEEKYNYRSSFNFISMYEYDSLDPTYNIMSEKYRNVIRHLKDNCWEIGLHASTTTFNSPQRLSEEKECLEAVCNNSIHGVRQHFLLFNPFKTNIDHEKSGFTYDSSLGFYDKTGLRVGTSNPFFPFDNGEKRQLNLLQLPLTIMDSALHEEISGNNIIFKALDKIGIQPVNIEKAFSLCKQLIDNIIDTNGMITLLWHVKYMNYNWLTLYEKLLKYLSENDLWVTTPCEVNKWWRERYLLLNK